MSRKVAPVNLKYCIVPKDLIVMHILPNIECGEIPNFIRAFQGHIPRSLYEDRIPRFIGGAYSEEAGGTLVKHEFWRTNQGHYQGIYETFYANRLSSVVKRRNTITYHNNKQHGKEIHYDSKCNIELEQYYVDDILEGESTKYCNNIIVASEYYKNGLLDGQVVKTYMDGMMYIRTNYVWGIKHGLFEKWFRNSLQERSMYMNGILHGPYEQYRGNGNLMVSEMCVDGQYHGSRTKFDEDGLLKKSMTYYCGKLHGLKTIYKKDKIIETRMYVNGELIDEPRYFNEHGRSRRCR